MSYNKSKSADRSALFSCEFEVCFSTISSLVRKSFRAEIMYREFEVSFSTISSLVRKSFRAQIMYSSVWRQVALEPKIKMYQMTDPIWELQSAVYSFAWFLYILRIKSKYS